MNQIRKLMYDQKFPKTPIPPREDISKTNNNSRRKYTPGDYIWLFTILFVQVILLVFIIKSFYIKIELKDWGVIMLVDLLITKDALTYYRSL